MNSLANAPLTEVVLKVHRYRLTVVSGNGKTGPIAVTTSSRSSCWPGCPFYGQACYGEQYHQSMHWNKVSNGQRGGDMESLVKDVLGLPMRSKIRVNVTGDQPWQEGPGGECEIDYPEASKLARACKSRKLQAWTYCHHEKTDVNLRHMIALTSAGLVVNASCETEAQADRVVAGGGLAALVVEPDEKRASWKTEGGNKVVVCPEQRGLVANCLMCDAFCAKQRVGTGGGQTAPRPIVAFLGHYKPEEVRGIIQQAKAKELLLTLPVS